MMRYLPRSEQRQLGGPGPDCQWIDLVDPTQEEADLVRERFGIKVPTLESLREIEASSRLRVDGDALYMSAPLLSGTLTERWMVAPTGFVLTPNHIATVRYAELPAIEVHISNIYKRESFRHRSYISPAAVGVIAGLGSQGYLLALQALACLLGR